MQATFTGQVKHYCGIIIKKEDDWEQRDESWGELQVFHSLFEALKCLHFHFLFYVFFVCDG